MNSSLTIVQASVIVEVHENGKPGRQILLQDTTGLPERKGASLPLGVGKQEFFIVTFHEQPERGEWALLIKNEHFGLPIKNLKALSRAEVVEVTHRDGGEYFNE